MPANRNNEEPKVKCFECGNEITESESYLYFDNRYCQECSDELFFNCARCENDELSENGYYVEDLSERWCESCYDNHGFCCQGCDVFLSNDAHRRDGYCDECYEDEEDEDAEPVYAGIREDANTKSVALQSKDMGDIIKSPRKFGIELECVFKTYQSKKQLSEVLNKDWGFSYDGSIRTSGKAIGDCELVSPIMSGKTGEDEVKKIAKAYEFGFFVNNSCGYHLHLDSPDFKRDTKDDRKGEKIATDIWRLRTKKTNEIYQEYSEAPYLSEEADRKYNLAKEIKYENLIVNYGENFQRLRDLWYVYLAFDDIFRGMLPSARRTNSFCKASSSIYSLSEIRELEDYSELERLWYKTDKRMKLLNQMKNVDDRKRGKDHSRYCGFNLEPLLRQKSQTIEIRYHSPTLNPEKILRWIDIHQTIFDYIANNQIDETAINNILSTQTHLILKARAMCKLFKIRKDTAYYIEERLHKFNKLNSPDEIDEEVEASPLGSPAHRHTIPMMNRNSARPYPQSDFHIQLPTFRSAMETYLAGNTHGQVLANELAERERQEDERQMRASEEIEQELINNNNNQQ